MTAHEGSCYCGAVQFTVDGPLDEVDLCHCSQCRRANGGAFNVAVIVDADQVEFSSRGTLKEFSKTAGKIRAFCSECGSPIYSRKDNLPQKLRLRGGTIIDLAKPSQMRHIHYASRWPWIEDMFESPKFSER